MPTCSWQTHRQTQYIYIWLMVFLSYDKTYFTVLFVSEVSLFPSYEWIYSVVLRPFWKLVIAYTRI